MSKHSKDRAAINITEIIGTCAQCDTPITQEDALAYLHAHPEVTQIETPSGYWKFHLDHRISPKVEQTLEMLTELGVDRGHEWYALKLECMDALDCYECEMTLSPSERDDNIAARVDLMRDIEEVWHEIYEVYNDQLSENCNPN